MIVKIIIPIKGLVTGKTRLAAILPPAERAELNRRFFAHTLDVAAVAPGLGHTIVVSADAETLDAARARGATTVAEPADAGLNGALDAACGAALAAGAGGILVLPTDLPLLTQDDIAAMIPGQPGIAIAPDRGGTGTNALFVAPPGAIPFRFGPNSCAAHTSAARDAGLPPSIIRRPNLAFDIDTPDDYRAWVAITKAGGK